MVLFINEETKSILCDIMERRVYYVIYMERRVYYVIYMERRVYYVIYMNEEYIM